MTTISSFEAKTRFGELLDRVANGEEVVITRHDKPVARVIPEGGGNLAEMREAAEGLLALRDKIAKRLKDTETLTDSEVRSAIEEGRR